MPRDPRHFNEVTSVKTHGVTLFHRKHQIWNKSTQHCGLLSTAVKYLILNTIPCSALRVSLCSVMTCSKLNIFFLQVHFDFCQESSLSSLFLSVPLFFPKTQLTSHFLHITFPNQPPLGEPSSLPQFLQSHCL